MKRFTSAALVLGALMAMAPAGAFAEGFDRGRGDRERGDRERVRVVRVDRVHEFERARIQREWREHVRVRFENCR